MTERKHILIVGAGAIGGLYAAYLAKVADVAVLDTNRAHFEAIRQDGLRLTGCTESVTKLAPCSSTSRTGWATRSCSRGSATSMSRTAFRSRRRATTVRGRAPPRARRGLLARARARSGRVSRVARRADDEIGPADESGRRPA